MEIPYTVTARKDTGLFNSKVGIWLFLASEVMLFGGLFSGYVFLRVYADYPWPERALPVVPGLINTFILIASSVTVVFAWAALKMRKFRQFQIFMFITLICAGVFMVLKGIEYKAKWEHQAVRMNDFAIVEGHTHKGYLGSDGKVHHQHHASVSHENPSWMLAANQEESGGHHSGEHASTLENFELNRVAFLTEEVVVSLDRYDESYINHILEQAKGQGSQIVLAKDLVGRRGPDEAEKVIVSAGNELSPPLLSKARDVYLDAKANNAKIKTKQLRDAWAAIRGNKENKGKPGYQLKEQLELDPEFDKFVVGTTSSLTFKVEPACVLVFAPRDIRETEENGVLKDGTVVKGKLDTHGSEIAMAVDAIDFRYVAQRAEEKGIEPQVAIHNTWLLKNNPQIRKIWDTHSEKIAELEKELEESGRVPTDTERYRVTWQNLVNYGEGKEVKGTFSGFAGPDHKQDYAKHFPEVVVPRSEVNLESKFTPRWNTYYAIYFLITALHGLHVIGGAIVLGHFVFFGKKLYLKNPEHLANRVEVGGLFWHFVDLVWIFLFPILYLM